MSRTYHVRLQRKGWELLHPHSSIFLLSRVFMLLWVTQPGMLLLLKHNQVYFAAKKKSLTTFIFLKKQNYCWFPWISDKMMNNFMRNQHLIFQTRHLFYKPPCSDGSYLQTEFNSYEGAEWFLRCHCSAFFSHWNTWN